MTDQTKKYPENYKEERSVIFCPHCGAKIEKGQRFCLTCGADLRKYENEMEDVYGGPEYFDRNEEKPDYSNMTVLYGPPEVLFGNKEEKETPEKKEEPVPIEKINESEMIGVYAAPAPKMSLTERIKEKLTK